MADDLSQHGADPFASFDSAASAPVPEPLPQDTTDHGPDPFAQFDPENQPVETGAGGAFMHHAERGLVPSLTGMAGAGMGAAVGTELGGTAGFAVAGPIGVIPGGIVGALGGGLAGFMGGAQAMSSAQDWLIKQMPESWQELLGQSEKQRAAEETQQPIASQIGELAPFVITMRPGFGGIPAAVPENASVLRRIWASPMTSHLLSGGLQGGTEAISEVAAGEKPDPTRIAIATSFGLLFNKPTKLGERLTELGEHPIRVIAGRNEPAAVTPEVAAAPERQVPTIAEAADAQVLGPGITEGVFLGSVKQDPALRDAQQTAAHDEATVLTPAETNPVETARTMEPELFAHYDDLQAQRADLAAHPDTAAVQQHIAATDAELRAIEPEVAAAHRRAADVAQTPTVEPPAPEPVQPTQPAPNGQVPTAGPSTELPRGTLDAEQAAIAQEVTANLIAAGQAPDLAAANAQVWAHYYRTRASKFKGALGSPMEVYQREAPEIRAMGTRTPATELAQRGQPPETELFQPAYHGTPHIFDKFDSSKIGTGEGAQAFGHGLYFAGRKEIATYYRKKLAGARSILVDGKPIDQAVGVNFRTIGMNSDQVRITSERLSEFGPLENVAKWKDDRRAWGELANNDISRAYGFQRVLRNLEDRVINGDQSPADALNEIEMDAAISSKQALEVSDEAAKSGEHPRAQSSYEFARDYAVDAAIAHALSKKSDAMTVGQPGRLLTVDVPEHHELLDWEKPLSEQPKDVIAKLRAIPGVDAILKKMNAEDNQLLSDLGHKVPDGTSGLPAMSGAEFYKMLSKQTGFSTEAERALVDRGQIAGDQIGEVVASRRLREAGIPGHRFLDQASRNPKALADARGSLSVWEKALEKSPDDAYIKGEVEARRADVAKLEAELSHNYVIYDDSRVSVTEYEQGANAALQLRGGGKNLLELFETANSSSLIHESGHQWLEDLVKDAIHPQAPDTLKDDALTVREALGMKPDQERPTKRQHERWARWTEQYFREGVAPSPALARVFAQFKQWLTQIYQSIRGLGAPINEDIRQVFDRMLAEEPNRTVIAPDQLERGPTLHDIHETEAEDVTPEQAGPVADRIVAERDDYLARQPAEIRNELETAVAQQEEAKRAAGGGTEPTGEAGPSAEPGAAVGDAGGEPVAEPAGGPGGGQPSPVVSSGGEVVPQGGNGAELRSNGPGVAGDARTLPPEPEPAINRAPRFVDKAGNIRLDNINTTDDIKQVLRDFAEQNNDFIDYRRGVLKAGDILNLAHAIGETDPDFLMRRRIGQSFNAEQIKYAEKLLSQSAQALALTMKPGAGATPIEVQAYAAARSRHQMIQAHFSGITAEAGRALAALRRTQAFWSPEAAAADKASREATGRTLFQLQQEMAFGAELDTPEKVSRFLRDATKKNFVDGILEYWISALLSGTKTLIVNDVSNLITAVNHFGPDIAAAAIAGRVRKALGREGPRVHASEIAVAARAAVEKGIPIGVKAMLDSFKAGRGVALPEQTETPVLPFVESAPDIFNGPPLDEGATYREIVPEVYGMVKGAIDAVISNGKLLAAGGVKGSPLILLRDTATGVIPNLSVRGVEIPTGDIIRLPLRNLSSHDSFFRAANYTIEKARTAYRTALEEGLKPNTPAFARRVAEASDNFTPEQMTEASDVAHSLTFMGRRGPFTSALVRLAQSRPFNMPLPKFIVPFVSTPLAIIESTVVHRTPLAFLAPEVRADLMGRNGNIAQDMAVGRLLMGALYGIAAAGLTSMRMLSSSGPQNSNDAAAWRMAGNQAHSVRIGDMWYQVNQLGPIGLWLSMVADGHDVAGAVAQGDWPTVFSGMQQAFSQNVVDMSSLTGVSDLMQAISDPDRYGTNYVSKFLSSFVPAIAAQVARSTDPYQRQARGILETAQARIPFQSQNLPVKRDIYGDPIPQNMPAFGAVYAAKVQTDPLNLAFQEGGYWPGYVKRTIRGVQLTEAEFDQYSMVAGRLLRQNLMPVVGSPQWQSLPAARKYDILSKAVTMSRESARNFMLGRYPRIAVQAVRTKQGLDETP